MWLRHQARTRNRHQPVDGWLTSNYGTRRDPRNGRLKFHAGLDIAAPTGTIIRASGDGVVNFAGWRDAYGRMVIIDHGYGMVSRYAHASRLLVEEGERVTRGQIIARVGATGRTTGPHLHYEIHKNGVAVNPIRYMERQAPPDGR